MNKLIVTFLFCCLFSALQGANYGSWNSPISAEAIAVGSTYILNMQIEGEYTYWSEMRPQNGGRYTIVRRDSSGKLEDMTPPDFNVRTRVHEYGGGAFTVASGTIFASNGVDGAIYLIEPGSKPRPLTKGETRFADMKLTPFGLVAVGEYHEPTKPVLNFLALIDLSTGNYKKLASDHDFYSSPALSPDGKKIAWISWNHPQMPWTNTELWIAEFGSEGELQGEQQICGSIPESIFQPQWSPDGTLYFVTDRDSGWWNLHALTSQGVENVYPMEAETAEPLWTFGLSTYAFLGNKIVFTYNRKGRWHLAILDPKTKKLEKIKREGTYLHQLRSNGSCVQFLEQHPTKSESLIQIKEGFTTTLYSAPFSFEEGYLSKPMHITFPSGERIAHGFFYFPQNKDYKDQWNEKPPLIVMIHGGPTAQASNSLHLEHQFWTSRGFALLDVNYGGSTGYGRSYRCLLDHNWGVVDVEDCVNGALFLVRSGLVDGNKLAIRGKSAGGYTTLAALCFTKTFNVGASYYGIADITALALETHKFEKSYAEQLIGKYPEEKQLWESRSPINSVDQITSPLILFQGEEDPIVPKNQSIMIYEALKKRGVPVELHLFRGAGHGFRKAKNIVDSLNYEAEFYLKVFNDAAA